MINQTSTNAAASNTLSNSLAFDVRAVDSLRQLNKTSPEAAAKAAAQQFEALLVQQMMSSMRKATESFDELDSSSTKMFRGMQDQQMAQSWSKNGGLGFADSILRQIQVQRDPSLLKKAQRSVPLGWAGLDSVNEKAKTLGGKIVSPAAKDAASTTNSNGFMADVLDAAKSVSGALGVSSQVLAAHAALETGWGKKPIKDSDGIDSHNLFGIKAGSGWTGKTVDITTTEYVDGAPQKKVDKFRAYDSYKDAFADYAQLIKRRFSDAVGQGSDAAGFGSALQQSGYATDPAYANKLARVADRVSRLYGNTTSNLG